MAKKVKKEATGEPQAPTESPATKRLKLARESMNAAQLLWESAVKSEQLAYRNAQSGGQMERIKHFQALATLSGALISCESANAEVVAASVEVRREEPPEKDAE